IFFFPRLEPLFKHKTLGASSVSTSNVRQAWRKAVEASIQNRYLHANKGMQVLLEAFYALPVAIGGWGLQQAACDAQGNRWQCQVQYTRSGPDASNDSFLKCV